MISNLKQFLGKESEFINKLESVQKEMDMRNLDKISFYLKLNNLEIENKNIKEEEMKKICDNEYVFKI